MSKQSSKKAGKNQKAAVNEVSVGSLKRSLPVPGIEIKILSVIEI